MADSRKHYSAELFALEMNVAWTQLRQPHIGLFNPYPSDTP
jgi:hypothetical protein